MSKSNAQLKADLEKATLRIKELEAELKANANKSLTQAENPAIYTAQRLKPDVEVLGAKFNDSGVLVAVYDDGERIIYDQDAIAELDS